MNQQILENGIRYVQMLFAEDHSGHDPEHTFRVLRLAERLARQEGAELLTVQLAALLHDADDRKLSPETWEGKERARLFLRQNGVPEEQSERIINIIREVSFLGTDSVVPSSIEGRCVQDADRLDAIGAIGAARAFTFGGRHGRVLHDPKIPPVQNIDAETYCSHVSTTINHFYEKLLLLPGMMTTEEGKRLAACRGKFLEEFLQEFLLEWEGKR